MLGNSTLPDFILQQRLRDLEDHIKKDLALLKDFEEELRYEDDPKRKARYRRDVQALRESAEKYTIEYQDLLTYTTQTSNGQSQSVAIQLKSLSVQLDQVQAQLDDISSNLLGLRKEVLSRLDTSEQTIVSAIVAKLDETQLQTVNEILMAIEDNHLLEKEATQLLQPLYAALVTLQQHGRALPGSSEVVDVISAPNMDVRHKLKVSIPIIPAVLAYEGEISLGDGMNLEAAWNTLKDKVRSRFSRK